jgi:hypothetical protein
MARKLSVATKEKRNHRKSSAPLMSPSQVRLARVLELLKDAIVDLVRGAGRNRAPNSGSLE